MGFIAGVANDEGFREFVSVLMDQMTGGGTFYTPIERGHLLTINRGPPDVVRPSRFRPSAPPPFLADGVDLSDSSSPPPTAPMARLDTRSIPGMAKWGI